MGYENVLEMKRERAGLLDELRKVDESARAEERDLSEDESAKFTATRNKIDNIDKAIIVDVDGQAIASEEGKRVAARALLKQFQSNDKYREHPEVLENEPIEGKVVGGDSRGN